MCLFIGNSAIPYNGTYAAATSEPTKRLHDIFPRKRCNCSLLRPLD